MMVTAVGLLSVAVLLSPVSAQAPAATPTPVVVSLVATGQVSAETHAVAAKLTDSLQALLGRERALRILDRRTGPPSTGVPVAAHYYVAGELRPTDREGFALTVRTLDVETGVVIRRDSSRGSEPQLRAALAAMAVPLTASIQAAVTRAPTAAPGPAPAFQAPASAVQAYSRGVLALDRGDTVQACRQLQLSLQEWPAYAAARRDLARLASAGHCRN